MATATESDHLNEIKGRVIVKETYIGVPGVVVTAYDIDSDSYSDEKVACYPLEPGTDFWNRFKNADRLASEITDESGQFSCKYPDSAFRSNNGERRPDLMLVVTAPEQQGTEPCPTILHLSCGIRQNAATVESYVIWIPSEVLKKAGLKVSDPSAIPPDEETPQIIKKMEEDLARESEITEGSRVIVAKRVERKHQIRDSVEDKVKEFLTSISIPPFDPSNSFPGTFVKPDENVQEVTDKVLNDGLALINTSPGQIGATLVKHVSVAQDQLAALQDASGNFRTDIPAEEVDYILSRPYESRQQSDTN